jgi:glycosyltransferase involved in cell wall biosynthesis
MCLGTPVLASCVGGLKEVLVHERTGLLFNPADATAICESVCRILAKPDLVKGLSINARQDVDTHLSAQHMAGQYLELFMKLAAKTRQI